MKYLVAFLLTVIITLSAGQNSTPSEASCEAFSKINSAGKLAKAVQVGDCSVSCTFLQYYDQDGGQESFFPAVPEPPAGGGGGSGGGASNGGPSYPDDSVDPSLDLLQNGGGTVEVTVTIAMSGLEKCGENKVCVSGICTDLKTESVANCVANVGVGAVAVESSRKCYVKCLRVVTNYNRRSYQGTPAVKELLILNLVKPDTAPCGIDKRCNSGYCMSEDLFSSQNCPQLPKKTN